MSAQLDLWQAVLDAQPWQGKSPRELTRGYKALFLRREPQKDDRFLVGSFQHDLFHAAKEGSRRYAGAPLLFPFKDGRT